MAGLRQLLHALAACCALLGFLCIAPSSAEFVDLPLSHDGGYLSACVLTRDTHLDIRDWVEWHLHLGVGKIFLFDHASRPPLYVNISDFVEEGRVQYTYFTSDVVELRSHNLTFADSVLGRVYRQCFALARKHWKWMMFTDSDE
ncbi:hypothetical protein GPECTOR_3g453 [Gonium pectorale]|uniref:Glycosyltransferase family 92 protein n=1 Tax=Gonium pectorale TaxID=33097 RepID=A0A150H177_GONPE|nr:hypothetical protein GPECTOR_3g453 [Gonium pectorale]|eukprot:KXZ55320.1 hypothetical protein GPECTOR_3g453 [Gonium pectorale]